MARVDFFFDSHECPCCKRQLSLMVLSPSTVEDTDLEVILGTHLQVSILEEQVRTMEDAVEVWGGVVEA